MTLRKNRLVVEAAACAGVTNVAGGRIVNALLKAIEREVARGREVRLARFGSFVCEDLPPKGGRSVGKVRREVRFKAGKTFRDAIDV